MNSMQLARATASGGQVLSLFSGRRNEIVRHVLGSPADSQNMPLVSTADHFAKYFDRVRNPPGMIDALHLQRHMTWLTLLTEKHTRRSDSHGTVAAIVYRYDRESMLEERRLTKDHIYKKRQEQTKTKNIKT